ncbi:MAG: ABC transporter substrate-binding protein [Oxalobacter sp.]|nr:ABC transporter substrate-binding protein [Oxalobacter sp.]
MKSIKKWFLALMALTLLTFTSMAQAQSSPDGVINAIKQSVLSAAANAPKGLSSAQINSLVRNSIAPHVDFMAASSVACGQYWYQATDSQKSKIAAEFKELLIRSYSKALGKVNSKTTMDVYSVVYNSNNTATVPARINNNGTSTPLFFGLTARSGSWKIFDANFANIWLISSSFKTQFTGIIKKSGIDGLIANLAKKNGRK